MRDYLTRELGFLDAEICETLDNLAYALEMKDGEWAEQIKGELEDLYAREEALKAEDKSYVSLTFVCFECKWAARRMEGPRMTLPVLCPHCRNPMMNMGQDFKTPKKKDAKGWRIAEANYRRTQLERK